MNVPGLISSTNNSCEFLFCTHACLSKNHSGHLPGMIEQWEIFFFHRCIYFFIHSFKRQSDTEKSRGRESSFIYWFTSQVARRARCGPGCSQEPRTPSVPCRWVTGAKCLSCGLFIGLPSTLARSWIGNRASQGLGQRSSGLVSSGLLNLLCWPWGDYLWKFAGLL